MRFLKELYNYYHSWPLVLAAYNGGHGRVRRALENQNSDSFFDLSLPEETERYYFKIVATKILLTHPQKYGFQLKDEDFFEPVPVNIVKYAVKKERISIENICAQFDLSQAEFKYLNPKVIGSYLPRGNYDFNIPVEKKVAATIKDDPQQDDTYPESDNPQNIITN